MDWRQSKLIQIAKGREQRIKATLGGRMIRIVDSIFWAALSGLVRPALATRLSRRLDSLIPPTAMEVVTNYIRGIALFGRSHGAPAFEWKMFSERSVITPDTAKLPGGLRRIQRRGEFEVRFNNDFESVVQMCQVGRDTWITPELVDIYRELNKLGYVLTVETYRDEELVGGMYGVLVGGVFGIMSMFHTENYAGTIALAALVDEVASRTWLRAIDCGPIKPHFQGYGAFPVTNSWMAEFIFRGVPYTTVDDGLI